MRDGIPGTVEDAIEIKRKCEPTCRARWPPVARVAFIRVLRIATCSRGFAAGSYANTRVKLNFNLSLLARKELTTVLTLLVKQKVEKKKRRKKKKKGGKSYCLMTFRETSRRNFRASFEVSLRPPAVPYIRFTLRSLHLQITVNHLGPNIYIYLVGQYLCIFFSDVLSGIEFSSLTQSVETRLEKSRRSSRLFNLRPHPYKHVGHKLNPKLN